MATKKAVGKTSAKKAAPAKKKTTSRKKITSEDIRIRAQQIYHDRLTKGQHGDEVSDWLSAEKELLSKG